MVHAFSIENSSIISQIQKCFNNNFEKKSIASELAMLSLTKNHPSTLRTSDHLILLNMQDADASLKESIKNGIRAAKECYENIEKRKDVTDNPCPDLKRFLLLLYFDWDLIVLPAKDSLLIAAIKN